MKIYFSYNEDPTPEGFTKANPDDMQSIEAGTVEECHGTNILEKVSDLPLFLDNVYAILTPGGKAVFQSGYYGCATSYMSPLVKRSLSEHSMNWCSKEWRELNKWSEVKTDINFDIAVGLATDSSLNLRSDEVQQLWRGTRLNCVLQVHFTLTKK
jgi:hypothetical protein